MALHGSVDPIGAGWTLVQTQGTPSSCTPRYGSHVQRSGCLHSLPHIVHGWPTPSSFAAGGQPGGTSYPTSMTPASRGPPHIGLLGDEQPAAAPSSRVAARAM